MSNSLLKNDIRTSIFHRRGNWEELKSVSKLTAVKVYDFQYILKMCATTLKPLVIVTYVGNLFTQKAIKLVTTKEFLLSWKSEYVLY